MPLTKPKFAPGIIRDDSPLTAEGGWIDLDKIRFHPDSPETIGGWQQLTLTPDPATISVFDPEVFDPEVFRDNDLLTAIGSFPGHLSCAHAWNDNSGNAYLAWGTSAGLYVMYDATIYDITPVGFVPEVAVTGTSLYGVGLYGASVYGSKRPVSWSLDNWGENLLACPRGNTLFEWTPRSPIALIVATAPTSIEYMFVSPERIVVALGTYEFGGTINPMLVRWSDQGNNTDWTPTPSNAAGEFPLAQGSHLMSGLVTRAQNLLWSDTAAFAMQFTGDINSVYNIRAVGRTCGLIGPRARAASDDAVFWASHDNFFKFTGQVPQVLPSKIRREVFDNIYPGMQEKFHVGWNSGFEEAWFFYPDARDASGNCSRYGMMNIGGNWAIGTFDRTVWVKAGVFNYPIAFSSDNQIYYHDVPNADAAGAPLEAFVESGFVDVGDGDTLYVIRRIVPDFDDQGPTVDLTFKTRLWSNGTISTRGPYAATPATEKLDMRVKARQIALRAQSAGASPSFWQLGAVSFDAVPSGEKR